MRSCRGLTLSCVFMCFRFDSTKSLSTFLHQIKCELPNSTQVSGIKAYLFPDDVPHPAKFLAHKLQGEGGTLAAINLPLRIMFMHMDGLRLWGMSRRRRASLF